MGRLAESYACFWKITPDLLMCTYTHTLTDIHAHEHTYTHTNTHIHTERCDVIILINRKESLGRVRLKAEFSYKRPSVSDSLEVRPMPCSAMVSLGLVQYMVLVRHTVQVGDECRVGWICRRQDGWVDEQMGMQVGRWMAGWVDVQVSTDY